MENVIVGIYPQAFPCAASSSCVITDDAKGGQPKRKVLSIALFRDGNT